MTLHLNFVPPLYRGLPHRHIGWLALLAALLPLVGTLWRLVAVGGRWWVNSVGVWNAGLDDLPYWLEPRGLESLVQGGGHLIGMVGLWVERYGLGC